MNIQPAGSALRRLRRLAGLVRRRGVKGAARLVYDRLNKLPMIEFGLRHILLPPRIHYVSGPRHVSDYPAGPIAICVVRNGELWVRSFLSHHRERGVGHFVILDNGSTDQTLRLFSGHADVTLLQTNAPYSAYENTMKRYLARRYCMGRWCLCVDVDELFDFPHSEEVSLAELVSYFDSRNFNAVVCQMLDMFSDEPLREVKSNSEDDIYEKYSFYDISAIYFTQYLSVVPDERIRMHRGGIRGTIFGTDNGLTKISLFRMDGLIKPFIYWHHAENARIADISAVLLHYPFVESFYAKVVDAVKDGRYGYLTSDEYGSYLAGLTDAPDLKLKLPSARRLENVDQLIAEGFLVVSQDYLDFAGGSRCS